MCKTTNKLVNHKTWFLFFFFQKVNGNFASRFMFYYYFVAKFQNETVTKSLLEVFQQNFFHILDLFTCELFVCLWNWTLSPRIFFRSFAPVQFGFKPGFLRVFCATETTSWHLQRQHKTATCILCGCKVSVKKGYF